MHHLGFTLERELLAHQSLILHYRPILRSRDWIRVPKGCVDHEGK